MIPVEIHYRGAAQEQRCVAAVPLVGCYLYGPGAERRLWQVSAVAIDEAVEVFALEVSPRLAGELTAAWAAWGEAIVAADEAYPTRPDNGRAFQLTPPSPNPGKKPQGTDAEEDEGGGFGDGG